MTCGTAHRIGVDVGDGRPWSCPSSPRLIPRPLHRTQARRAAEGPALLQGCGRRGARCHPLVTPNGRGSTNSTAGGRKRVFNSTCRSSWRWADGDSTWWAAGASAVARKRCHRLRLCPQTLSQVGIWVRTLQGYEIPALQRSLHTKTFVLGVCFSCTFFTEFWVLWLQSARPAAQAVVQRPRRETWSDDGQGMLPTATEDSHRIPSPLLSFEN